MDRMNRNDEGGKCEEIVSVRYEDGGCTTIDNDKYIGMNILPSCNHMNSSRNDNRYKKIDTTTDNKEIYKDDSYMRSANIDRHRISICTRIGENKDRIQRQKVIIKDISSRKTGGKYDKKQSSISNLIMQRQRVLERGYFREKPSQIKDDCISSLKDNRSVKNDPPLSVNTDRIVVKGISIGNACFPQTDRIDKSYSKEIERKVTRGNGVGTENELVGKDFQSKHQRYSKSLGEKTEESKNEINLKGNVASRFTLDFMKKLEGDEKFIESTKPDKKLIKLLDWIIGNRSSFKTYEFLKPNEQKKVSYCLEFILDHDILVYDRINCHSNLIEVLSLTFNNHRGLCVRDERLVSGVELTFKLLKGALTAKIEDNEGFSKKMNSFYELFDSILEMVKEEDLARTKPLSFVMIAKCVMEIMQTLPANEKVESSVHFNEKIPVIDAGSESAIDIISQKFFLPKRKFEASKSKEIRQLDSLESSQRRVTRHSTSTKVQIHKRVVSKDNFTIRDSQIEGNQESIIVNHSNSKYPKTKKYSLLAGLKTKFNHIARPFNLLKHIPIPNLPPQNDLPRNLLSLICSIQLRLATFIISGILHLNPKGKTKPEPDLPNSVYLELVSIVDSTFSEATSKAYLILMKDSSTGETTFDEEVGRSGIVDKTQLNSLASLVHTTNQSGDIRNKSSSRNRTRSEKDRQGGFTWTNCLENMHGLQRVIQSALSIENTSSLFLFDSCKSMVNRCLDVAIHTGIEGQWQQSSLLACLEFIRDRIIVVNSQPSHLCPDQSLLLLSGTELGRNFSVLREMVENFRRLTTISRNGDKTHFFDSVYSLVHEILEQLRKASHQATNHKHSKTASASNIAQEVADGVCPTTSYLQIIQLMVHLTLCLADIVPPSKSLMQGLLLLYDYISKKKMKLSPMNVSPAQTNNSKIEIYFLERSILAMLEKLVNKVKSINR